MSNFFKEMLRTQPHTLDEVRASLYKDLADHKQLVPILKEHHGYIRESISYLLDNDSTDFQKQEHLERFFRLIEMHAKAEEETLYKHLKETSSIVGRIEGLSGKTEHDIVFHLEVQLNTMNYKNEWSEDIDAKSRVVAIQIKNHINEEEDTMFSIAESHMTQEELEDIRDEYIQKCINYRVSDNTAEVDAGEWKTGRHIDSEFDSFH